MSRSRGRTPSQRQLRVGEELRHVLADILARGDLRDSVLANLSITVSEVRASPDMRQATAFVMPLGGAGDPAEVVTALNRAAATGEHRNTLEDVYERLGPGRTGGVAFEEIP